MWLALLSAVVFALKDVATKIFFSKYDISPKQILFETYFFSMIILLLFTFPFIEFTLFYNYWYLFLVKAISLATSSILYITLLRNHDVSLISPLLNLSPLLLIVLSTLFLGEIITFFQFLGILIVLIGVYVLELHTTHKDKKSPRKFHFFQLFKKPSSFFIKVFVMLLAISTAALTDRIILSQGVSVITTIYFTSLLIFIIFSIYFIRKGTFFNSVRNIVKQPQTLVIAGLGLLDMGIILTALSHPLALVSIAIPLRRTSTLMSSIFGGMLFHEKHLLRKLISTALMIIGIVFIVG